MDSLSVETNLDSAQTEFVMPSAAELGISIASGDVPALTVGDTFDFPVTISWSVQGSSLLVMPTGSANAKGITQLGVSQESGRSVVDGKELASMKFVYKLTVGDTGSLTIPGLRFEIPTAMGQPLELKSEPVPVKVNGESAFGWSSLLIGMAVGICVLTAAVLRIRRRKAALAERKARETALEALREQMLVLKRRVNVADSREWLLELEKVCKSYAAVRFGLDEGKVNLETLAKNGDLKGWEGLVKAFAHARYGGGMRDAFENKETWKFAMKLMEMEEEE